jgi:hypothetical protein
VGTGEVSALEGESFDGVGEGLVGVHAEVLHVLPDHVVEGLLRDRDRHFLLRVLPWAPKGGKGFGGGFPMVPWFSPFMTYGRGAVSISNLVDLGLI